MSAIGFQPYYTATAYPGVPLTRPQAAAFTTPTNIEADRLLIRMPGFRPDHRWSQAMAGVIRNSVTKLPQFPTVEYLLHNLAAQYQGYKASEAGQVNALGLAQEMYYNAPSWSQFGQLRSPGNDAPPLPIRGRYMPYQNRAKQLFNGQPQHIMTAIINGERLPFTMTRQTPQGLSWHWMPPQQLPKVMVALNQLYSQILQRRYFPPSPQSLHHTVQQVAQFHWLMVQAMPYHRGTAGIADMATKVLLDAAGIKTGRWKANLSPDLEALTTPLESFTQNYAAMFDTPPSY